MREATHGGNGLLRQIILCAGIVLDHFAILCVDS